MVFLIIIFIIGIIASVGLMYGLRVIMPKQMRKYMEGVDNEVV